MTSYRPVQPVRFADLFAGALEPFGVRGHSNQECTDQARCLTDGNNYLWVYADDTGFVSHFARYVPNGVPSRILSAIAEAFDVDIASEYEPEYFGFSNQEEWDRALAKQVEEDNEKLYKAIMAYVRGEPTDLQPGTNGMLWAETAKELISENPDLASPDRKAELPQTVMKLGCMTVTLSDLDIAVADMLVTHEDDLP